MTDLITKRTVFNGNTSAFCWYITGVITDSILQSLGNATFYTGIGKDQKGHTVLNNTIIFCSVQASKYFVSLFEVVR